MRSIVQLLSTTLAILAIAGCAKFLDDPQPTDNLPIGTAFQTGEELEEALVGVYDACQNGHLYGRNMVVIPELLSGNAVFYSGGYFGLDYISSLQMNATDWYAENTWVLAYQAINQANAIIAALAGIRQTDASLLPEQADRILGEALFLRSVLYFDLVRLYALPYSAETEAADGVPMMLDPVLKKEDFTFPTRASVAAVYEQVNKDLREALRFLPESNTAGRAGRYAAQAYLARVAFQQGRYAEAADFAGAILSGPFSLQSTPQDFFTREGNAEEIWVIQNTPDDPGGGLAKVFGLDGGNQTFITPDLLGDYAHIITPDQQAAIDGAGYAVVDLRSDTGYLAPHPLIVPDGVNSWRTNKYEDVAGQSDDIPMIRLAELLLLRAEALVRTKGLNAESIDLLNRVRRRSLRVVDANKQAAPGGDSYIEFHLGDFPDAAALLDVIIRERRVELAFEGNYFHDAMRLQRDVQGKPWKDCHLRLPIPQRERDVNMNLLQNPCY